MWVGFLAFDGEGEIGKRGWRLPHWVQDGRTYFVTFRLADSLPRSKREFIDAERDAWLAERGVGSVDDLAVLAVDEARRFRDLFSEKLEALLDAGYGGCLLRNSEHSTTVESALRFFDGKRYGLNRYVVMPNHVHVLVRPVGEWTVSQVLHSWKSYTAQVINKAAGRVGRKLWLEESFDHLVRSVEQLGHFQRYIDDNPRKAGLAKGSYRVGCGGWEPLSG